MDRKGFPESFDTARLLNFLAEREVGREAQVEAPVYSHFHYDILPDQKLVIESPDILIVEGLNVLQPARMPRGGEAIPFVSDFFDFSIYLDADPEVIEEWYVARFMRLRTTAFRDPGRLLPSIRAACRRRRARDARARDLAQHQPEESRGEHPPDAPACAPDPAQGSRPPRRVGRAAQAL